MTPEEQAEFYMYQMNKPCSRCFKMPIEHKHCPCLVIGCCGYAVNERCTEKLPSVAVVDGPNGPINWITDNTLPGTKAWVFDRDSILLKPGPKRTATYTFEAKTSLLRKIAEKLHLVKKKESPILMDWNPDIIASIKKEAGAIAFSDEYKLLPRVIPQEDRFRTWIERIEREGV